MGVRVRVSPSAFPVKNSELRGLRICCVVLIKDVAGDISGGSSKEL